MIQLNFLLVMLLTAACISITAFTYSHILTRPGELFSWPYKILDIFFKTDDRAMAGLGMHPLFKLLIGCEKCVSGQMALWIFTLLNLHSYPTDVKMYLIAHILFIGITIFFTTIIKSIYLKIID